MQSKLFFLVLPLVGAALAMPVEKDALASTVAEIQDEYTGLEARQVDTNAHDFDNYNVDELDKRDADEFALEKRARRCTVM